MDSKLKKEAGVSLPVTVEEREEQTKVEAAGTAIVDVSDFVFEWIRTQFPGQQIERQAVSIPTNADEFELVWRVRNAYSVSKGVDRGKWEDLHGVFKRKVALDAVVKRRDPAMGGKKAKEEPTPAAVDAESDLVFQWVRAQLPHQQIERQAVSIPRNADQIDLMERVVDAYSAAKGVGLGEWRKLYQAFKHMQTAMETAKPSDPPARKRALGMWELAFDAPFVGHAHERLFHYVEKCWEEYAPIGSRVRFPCIDVMQGAGFGKSRLLKEIALLCQDRNAKALAKGPDEETARDRFHLLYVCARTVEGARRFPFVTKLLVEHLFPKDKIYYSTNTIVEELAGKLVRLFDFVMHAQAASVDDQLLQLLVGDRKVSESVQSELCVARAPAGFRLVKDDARTRMLFVAIDEASALRPAASDFKSANVGWVGVFRRALAEANWTLQRANGRRSGVFGLVVDVSSKEPYVAPSAKPDPSLCSLPRIPLRPFVVTDTMDAFFNDGKDVHAAQQAIRYRANVLAAVSAMASRNRSKELKPSSWKELKTLGRPLWGVPNWTHGTLIMEAAKRLRGGDCPDSSSEINSRHGALASAMCRLGIRPYISTPLATALVANHMAVLSYVTSEEEKPIVSYSSDPILTLGAACTWYTNARNQSANSLSAFILPNLKSFLDQDVVDTGSVDELVARIVLLLAMDACAELETGDKTMRWLGAGEFYRVSTFLRALEGETAEVHRRPMEDSLEMADVRRVMHRWRHHFVSFTHFVQLSGEPTEACLWGLLGRRAAGILPRGMKGADVVIPICRLETTSQKRKAPDTNTEGSEVLPPVVTMILVRVKNYANGFSSLSKPVEEKLHPTFAFKAGNSLCRIVASDTLRVFVSLGDAESTPHCYLSLEKDAAGTPTSFALCVRGLGPWSCAPVETTSGTAIAPKTNRKSVEIVSESVASQLAALLGPWWSAAHAVDLDTTWYRHVDSLERPQALQKRARRSLGDSLVLNEPVQEGDVQAAGPPANQ